MEAVYGSVLPLSGKFLDCQIDILEPSFAKDVRAIHAEVSDKLHTDGHIDYVPSKKYTLDEWDRLLNTKRMLGAFTQNRLMGFVYLGKTSKENPQDGVPGMNICYPPESTGVLRTAMVSPRFQGLGVGRLLFKACVELAQQHGLQAIISGVTSTNVQSWSNMVKAGMSLVQVSEMPKEIAAASNAKAFYFYRSFVPHELNISVKDWALIDPIDHVETIYKLIRDGWVNTGLAKVSEKTMLLLTR